MEKNYCLFSVEIEGEELLYKDNCNSAADIINRYAECNGYIPDFTKDCERISDERYAELEQMGKPLPSYTLDFNVEENELTVWKNTDVYDCEKSFEKNTFVLSNAVQKVRNNENLYLFEVNPNALEEVYTDFLYRNDIYNNTHIAFVERYGELPMDISAEETKHKALVYCCAQLDNDNITNSQREKVEQLKELLLTEITLDYKDIKEITALNPNPLVKEKLSEWQDEAEKTIQKLMSRDEHIK